MTARGGGGWHCLGGIREIILPRSSDFDGCERDPRRGAEGHGIMMERRRLAGWQSGVPAAGGGFAAQTETLQTGLVSYAVAPPPERQGRRHSFQA